MQTIRFDLPQHKLDFTYRINFQTLLLDCERLHIPVTFHTHNRRYIGDYKAIDTVNKPITLSNYVCNGELIYYKVNQFEWKSIGLDSIDRIEVEKAPNLEWFLKVA